MVMWRGSMVMLGLEFGLMGLVLVEWLTAVYEDLQK